MRDTQGDACTSSLATSNTCCLEAVGGAGGAVEALGDELGELLHPRGLTRGWTYAAIAAWTRDGTTHLSIPRRERESISKRASRWRASHHPQSAIRTLANPRMRRRCSNAQNSHPPQLNRPGAGATSLAFHPIQPRESCVGRVIGATTLSRSLSASRRGFRVPSPRYSILTLHLNRARREREREIYTQRLHKH